MKRQLVILTTHFGKDFSGGSRATCEIFSRIEHHFEKIVVIGTKLGTHPFSNITFIKYKNWWHAYHILNKLNKTSSVFYGDFYNSFLYAVLKIPFYFTYHDNWPELSSLSLKYWLHSLFYTNCYKSIFKNAERVFSVSEFKTKYISRYCKNVTLVKNGFNSLTPGSKPKEPGGILMVGNVDHRKYSLATKLFSHLEKSEHINIDIYGRIQDNKIARKLKEFSFVNLKGFVNEVPYSNYKLLLQTSLMENLPIVFCEAISSNVPVLAFSVGGANEIINEYTGTLIPAYKIELMAEVLDTIQHAPINQDERMKIATEYSWDKASKKYATYMVL